MIVVHLVTIMTVVGLNDHSLHLIQVIPSIKKTPSMLVIVRITKIYKAMYASKVNSTGHHIPFTLTVQFWSEFELYKACSEYISES